MQKSKLWELIPLSCASEIVKEKVKEKAKDGKISCPLARKIAQELNVPIKEVGHACDDLDIRLYGCELGCF